jgi:tetratricopeptide (TPR) repeat protein
LIRGLYGADSLQEALQNKRYRDALALADAMLANRQNDPKALTARGIALGGLGRNHESIAAFEKALKAAPKFVPALQGAIELTYRSRDERAAGFLSRLLQISPENGVAQAMAGVLAFESGKCALAIQHFERGMTETANNAQAYPLYGACLLKTGRPADAVKVYKTLIAHSPREERNYIDLAALYIQQSALETAARVVDEGLRNVPGSARMYSIRGVIRAQTGRAQEAAADFNLANRLDAEQEYGAAGLGLLYTETKQTDLAISVLRDRLKKAPGDTMLNYLLAQAIVNEPVDAGSPQFHEARHALEKTLRAKPEFTKARTLLGKLYAQVGENSKALEELMLATKQDRNDRTALSQLAIVLRRLGRAEEAAAVLTELRQLVMQSSQPALIRAQ